MSYKTFLKTKMIKKIILFGGSFNPVHQGHVEMAKFAFANITAHELCFVPAKRSPFKKDKPQATDQQRVDMIKLAIDGFKNFHIDQCELNRPAPSYTVDTLKYFIEKMSVKAKLYWLIGADMVADLGKWYKIEHIFDLCTICVVNRGGIEKPDFEKVQADLGRKKTKLLIDNMIETPFIEISSTEIRERVNNGQKIDGLVPEKVGQYIISNNLYK